jgi:hypothetical protein
MFESPLHAIQALFYRLVTAPEGVGAALSADGVDPGSLAQWIVGGPEGASAFSALARLEVYAEAYFHRLLDVLRTDYPKLARAVGDMAFHNLVTDYLVAHPPADPSVRNAGQHLPAYLGRHSLGVADPQLCELAHLERARREVFDAADSAALDLAALQARAPEAFATLHVQLIRAHQVLTLRPAVERRWSDPDARAALADEAPCAWLVWRGRNPMVVHHLPLAASDAALLPLLAAGVPFARVCEQLAEHLSDDEAARAIGAWLTRWTEAGLLMEVEEG